MTVSVTCKYRCVLTIICTNMDWYQWCKRQGRTNHQWCQRAGKVRPETKQQGPTTATTTHPGFGRLIRHQHDFVIFPFSLPPPTTPTTALSPPHPLLSAYSERHGPVVSPYRLQLSLHVPGGRAGTSIQSLILENAITPPPPTGHPSLARTYAWVV